MSNTNQETNKAIVRRLFEGGMNQNRPEVIDDVISAEYVDATGERGPGAFKQVMTRLHGAFPDIHYVLDDLVAEGDKVATRWHWSGTHQGSFRGIPPTGRSLTNNGAAIFELSAGKVVAAALETDRLGFLQAIGVVPPNDALFVPPAAPKSVLPGR